MGGLRTYDDNDDKAVSRVAGHTDMRWWIKISRRGKREPNLIRKIFRRPPPVTAVVECWISRTVAVIGDEKEYENNVRGLTNLNGNGWVVEECRLGAAVELYWGKTAEGWLKFQAEQGKQLFCRSEILGNSTKCARLILVTRLGNEETYFQSLGREMFFVT